MALTSDDLADIKQLMEAVISQRVEPRFDEIDKRFEEIDKRFEEMQEQIDERFEEAAEVQNEILNAVGSDLAKHTAKIDDHDTRIARLEKRTA